MILGMSVHTFTVIHVLISLVGESSPAWSSRSAWCKANTCRAGPRSALLFLILTSVTGFFFPNPTFTPAQGVGIISLVILAVALIALYVLHLKGLWRWIYVVTAMIAIYFDCFVGVIQAFQKIDFLHALAPTQSTEPAFVVAQLVLLVIFVVLGYGALKSSIRTPHDVAASEHARRWPDPGR